MPIPAGELAVIQERIDAELRAPVKVDYFHQRKSALLVPGQEPCRSCEEVKTVLEQIATLSDRIDLHVYEFQDEQALARQRRIDRVPGIVLRGEINRPLRFFGLPGGVFFPVFFQAMFEAASPPTEPPVDVLRPLKKLRAPVSLRVFGSPSDEASGVAALLVYRLALASPRVDAAVYDIDEFPALAEQFGVRAAPATIFDDRTGLAGVVENGADLAAYLLERQAHPQRASLHLPKVRAGSARPWAPPETGASEGQPTAPGERRTPGGLILPGR